MNILLLLTDLYDSIGGIQTFNKALLKALIEIANENNFKIIVYVLNDKNQDLFDKNYRSLEFVECKIFKKNKFWFIYKSLLASFNANIVVIGHVNLSFLGFIIKSFKRSIVSYLVVHGIDVWKKLSFYKRLGVSSVNKVLSVSEFTKNEMIKFNNTNPGKFYILPSSLDEGVFNSKESVDKIKLKFPEGNTILTVSRLDALESYKNIDMVIQAMPLVIKNIPNAFYVIVGDGSDKKRLEKVAEKLSLENKIFFVGKVRSEFLHYYYKASNVFVLPSTGEGFGIVFLEAMYYGKPVIGAKAGAIPEVIHDQKTGLLVEPNPKSIAEAIVKILSNKSLSSSMGQAGKKLLEEEFSFNVFRTKLENILCH